MKAVYTILVSAGLLCAKNSFSQTYVLLKDINTTGSSDPQNLTKVNSTLFFSADDGTNGRELWRTDGTGATTMLVKDINASGASNPSYLTAFNGLLYFSANPDYEKLFQSDGTAAGTNLVTPTIYTPQNLTVGGTNLYFSGNGNDGFGQELWKIDNSGAASRASDINSSNGNSNPNYLTPAGSDLYFTAQDGTNGYAVWKYDGSNTTMIADINPTTTSGVNDPANLIYVNGNLFFTAGDGSNGIELYVYNGSTVTRLDINATGSSSPDNLTELNGSLYFFADDGSNGKELWKSDGSTVTLVKDIFSGSGGSNPTELTNVNGALYFRAYTTSEGYEVWKSDGSNSGTVLLKDINSGSNSSSPQSLTALYQTLFFSANDGTNGQEPWKSNGTDAGTVMVQDIETGSNSSNPQNFTNVNGLVYFTATTSAYGTELWVSNSLVVLPLNLLSFNVSLAQEDVLVQWSTANEINTSYFTVQRSFDGINFSAAGKVTAANSSGDHQYRFSDSKAFLTGAQKIFYRLQFNDIDGKVYYSRILLLPIETNSSSALLYPNPVVDEATLTIYLQKNDKIRWKLLDFSGKILQQNEKNLIAGSNSIFLNVSTLPKGIYFIQIQGTSLQEKIKFFKK